MARKRRDAATWRRLIEECGESGLADGEFCRRRGLSVSTLRWWRWRLRQERSVRRSEEVAVEGFVSLGAFRLETVEPISGVAVEMPSGLRVSVDRDFDVETLRRVLEVVGC